MSFPKSEPKVVVFGRGYTGKTIPIFLRGLLLPFHVPNLPSVCITSPFQTDAIKQSFGPNILGRSGSFAKGGSGFTALGPNDVLDRAGNGPTPKTQLHYLSSRRPGPGLICYLRFHNGPSTRVHHKHPVTYADVREVRVKDFNGVLSLYGTAFGQFNFPLGLEFRVGLCIRFKVGVYFLSCSFGDGFLIPKFKV